MAPGDWLYCVGSARVRPLTPHQSLQQTAGADRLSLRWSPRTASEMYDANICECGANFGDFYLFSEPGGAFFPDSDEGARSIELEVMPFEGTLRFVGSYSVGPGEYILRHAKRTSEA